IDLAGAADAQVLVDEAHAIGSIGPGGRGALADEGLEGEVDAIVGTLGKELGSYGAYVCGGKEMVRYLINTARSLIFSTAPGPPAVAGALAALELLQERPHRVERLRSNARALRRALAEEGFPVAEGEMQIVPLIVGEERDAMSLCQAALQEGVFAQGIRPPTVPAGTSRLRLTAMASHTASELRAAARVLGEATRALGREPAEMGPPLPQIEERPAEGAEEPFSIEARRGTPAGVERATAGGLFDGERDGETSEPRSSAAEADAGDAPFDFERDLSTARAA
ncbi:MAG TPA: aminotransferase class I/II-fold pyridoxal phosphate-dependent enzyme, partial [Solirubrobacteraceae bacterium]